MAFDRIAPATGAASFDGRSPVDVAPGVKLAHWYWCDDYTGTAEALIAFGIITADHLPEKSCATFYEGKRVSKGRHVERDENYLQVRRAGRKVSVCLGLSKVEQEQRWAAQRVQEKAEQQRREAEGEKLKAAREAAYYSDPKQLRFDAKIALDALWILLANHTPGDHEKGKPRFALRFSSEGIADILESLQEVREWIDEATVSPVKPQAPKGVAAAKAAKADKSFQAFLQAQCLKGE